MKKILSFVILLVLVISLNACGDERENIPGKGSSGSNYSGLIPPRPWDPGPKQGGNGYGYGYGSGGNYPSEIQVNCLVEPCVFGTCIVGNSNSTHCECDLGYSGRLCAECAEGYFEQGGLCIEEDECAKAKCVYGKCELVSGVATCKCYSGYAGEKCDDCAENYHIDENSRTCVAD